MPDEKATRQVMVIFKVAGEDASQADIQLLERLDGMSEKTGVPVQRLLKVAITDPQGLAGAEKRAQAWYEARRMAELTFELGEEAGAEAFKKEAGGKKGNAPPPSDNDDGIAGASGTADAPGLPGEGELPPGVTRNAQGHRVKGKIREMLAGRPSDCDEGGCGKGIAEGDLIIHDGAHKKSYCLEHGEAVLVAG